MGRLIVVRHGQATSPGNNGERLSPNGEMQARLLGIWLMRQGFQSDAVYAGPRNRHRQTAQLVGEMHLRGGGDWPEPTTLPQLDECNAELMLQHCLPQVMAQFPQVSALVQAHEQAKNPDAKTLAYNRLFVTLIHLWATGSFAHPDLESWADFAARVGTGLRTIVDRAEPDETILIITSGGPTATFMQQALGLAAERAVEFMWQCRHSSFSEFLYANGRLTLTSFNSVPHLDDAELWTYR